MTIFLIIGLIFPAFAIYGYLTSRTNSPLFKIIFVAMTAIIYALAIWLFISLGIFRQWYVGLFAPILFGMLSATVARIISNEIMIANTNRYRKKYWTSEDFEQYEKGNPAYMSREEYEKYLKDNNKRDVLFKDC